MTSETEAKPSEKKKGDRPEYVGWLEMEDKKYRLSLWKQRTNEEPDEK